MSALAIFDPCNVPSTDSSQFPTYGEKSIEVLLNHYGNDKFALILNDEETVKTAVISPEVHSECRPIPRIWKGKFPSLRWQTFPCYIVPPKCKINGFLNLCKVAIRSKKN